MPKKRGSKGPRSGVSLKGRKKQKALPLVIVALVLSLVAVEVFFSAKKGSGGGGSGGAGGCVLTATSQISRDFPFQDMEVAADGTLYAVDIQGLRIYKAGKAVAHKDLPWESQPQSSVAIGKDALFVNKTTAPELYRVEKDLSKMTAIPIEGAISLYGLAADGAGKLYVADQARATVYTLDESGRLLGNLGGPELDKGGLLRPTDLTVGDNGEIYVIDQGNYRIVRYSSEGKVLAAFKTPWDHATIERIGFLKGRLYINDHLGSGVYVLSPEGKLLAHCTQINGDFAMVAPGQLAAGKDGFLYVGSATVGQIIP